MFFSPYVTTPSSELHISNINYSTCQKAGIYSKSINHLVHQFIRGFCLKISLKPQKQWSSLKKTPKTCPTKFTLKLFKKWSIEIVRDIWFGKERFSDILKANPGLSTKVLSQRLRELEQYEIIEKIIISKTPLRAIYQLTEKGRTLNRIMYELAMFSYSYYAKEIFEGEPPTRSEMVEITGNIFKLDHVEL